MTDYCQYVDVFQGCDEIALPEPQGIAARWRMIKGLCGNNTPAAALPFGRITAGCFSGGYSSGYGRLMRNTHGEIRKLSDRNLFKGIAHLQNDGVGDIGTFYNYALLTPFVGSFSADVSSARDFDAEDASPGYYTCRDSRSGAVCEVTVTPRVALHRIRFPQENGRICIDFSCDGLYDNEEGLHKPAGKAHLRRVSDCEAAVTAELHGLPMHFYVSVSGAKGALRLWADHVLIDAEELSLPQGHAFGIVLDAGREASVVLGLSPKSMDVAQRDVCSHKKDFDTARADAYTLWNEALSRVQAMFDEEKDYTVFYSNLYHSLLKPCDFCGESFLYDGGEFVTEFATLWDQYKTALPLIFTLYPQISHGIVETLLRVAESTNRLPHTLMLCGDYASLSTNQARMLAAYTLTDAYFRGVPMDVSRVLRVIADDAFRFGRYDAYLAKPDAEKHMAYHLDVAEACGAAAQMAKEAGDAQLYERFASVAKRWIDAFDPQTGLVREGKPFYEGTRWNYSFRLLREMPERIALAGGKEAFCALADRFFGFAAPQEGESFEGFNNETDMESPYVYHFAGRHDRLCAVIDAGLRYMFTSGRGGVPGNNDSGGLCSCYVWNAIGLFPVSGQDRVLIGSPRARETTLTLSNGNRLTIRKSGEGIYVRRAAWNDCPLPSLSLSVRDVMQGGTIQLWMTERPSVG